MSRTAPNNTGPAYVITYRHRRGRLPGAGPGPEHNAEPLMVPGRHQGFSDVRGKGLVEAAIPMTSCDDGPDFHYAFGVDLFIAGVRALALA